MMMGNKTNCKNVCAIQATMMIALCDAIAAGSEISASRANAYAHHIEPTVLVILTAMNVLKRPKMLSPCTTGWTFLFKISLGTWFFDRVIAASFVAFAMIVYLTSGKN